MTQMIDIDTKRKLASIQIVESIHPIEGADNIVRARVMGWDVVVKKDEFKPGDPCVFFEIDSILPNDKEWSQFMAKHKFRVRTCRLRGVLSQGLALPISILDNPGFEKAILTNPHLKVGVDVSTPLRVTKHEVYLPTHGGGVQAGAFPHFVPKTDELRLQSYLGVLCELRDLPYVMTVKYDGASGTFFRKDDQFWACSRNWRLRDSEQCVWYAAARNCDLYHRMPLGFAVQAEVMGPGIQKNPLQLRNHQLFAFDVYDIGKQAYLDHGDFMKFCQLFGIPTVDVVETGSNFRYTLDELLEKAKGTYPGSGRRREGIVVRPQTETRSTTLGGRLSFKVLNNDFLLKDEE